MPPTKKGSTTAPVLSNQQKKALSGLAHRLKPVVWVGDKGMTDEVIAAVDAALLAHELIKVRLREPKEKKQMAETLARRSRSALCGLVGHTVILYRPHPKKPKIHLPAD